MTGFLYAVRAGNLIKTGFSRDPIRRRAFIQTGSPERCVLLGTIPASMQDERALHTRLAPHRIRSEWYRPEGAVLDFITTLCPFVQAREKRRNQAVIATGISKSHASSVLSGKRQCSLKTALRIFDGSGIKVGPLANADDTQINAVRALYAAPKAA